MLIPILRKTFKILLLFAVVGVILVAVYVSIGRQFMPAASRYTALIEEQILSATGVPVTVASMSGHFSKFNPVIQLTDLQVQMPSDGTRNNGNRGNSALDIGGAKIVLDIGRTLWQRRWVLDEFTLDQIEFDLIQSSEGQWRIRGIESGGGDGFDLESLYNTLQRVSRVDITNLRINVVTANGESTEFHDGTAIVQNSGSSHFIHIDSRMSGNQQQLIFSAELQGEVLSKAKGMLHANLPDADYSTLFSGQKIAALQIEKFAGGGDFWLDISAGRLQKLTSVAQLDAVTFKINDGESTTLENLGGKAALQRGHQENELQLMVEDFSVNWKDRSWSPFNAYVYLADNQSITAKVNNIDLSFLTALSLDSELLSRNIREEIRNFSPYGKFENLNLLVSLDNENVSQISLQANFDGVSVASSRGSPALSGLHGYIDASYDFNARELAGVVDLESSEFSINIPKLFEDTWHYDYVNASVDFQFNHSESQLLKLSSGLIVAKSELVDGNARFSTTFNRISEQEKESDFILMVGASRVEAGAVDLYLPDAATVRPELLEIMQWLEKAIAAGKLVDSGVVFRGSTNPDSAAEDKTFQSFFQLKDGDFEFDEAWPPISAIDALVLVDDRNVDVLADKGSTLGVEIANARATVRRDAEDINRIKVNASATTDSAQGLAYLQRIPVAQGLRSSLENWAGSGKINALLNLELPLRESGIEPDIDLSLQFENNELRMPDFELDFTQVSGTLRYDTDAGVVSSGISGNLFDSPVQLQLSSQVNDGVFESTTVKAIGEVTMDSLIDWPLQSELIKTLLQQIQGQIDYEANLYLALNANTAATTRLVIDSTLSGAEINLPRPFFKTVEESRPLHLELSFPSTLTDGEQKVSASIDEQLALELTLLDGQFVDGLVVAGSGVMLGDGLSMKQADGLAIVGELEYFDLQEWLSLRDQFAGTGSLSDASGLSQQLDFIRLDIDEVDVYGQLLPEVGLHLSVNDANDTWVINFSGEAVSGDLLIPFDQSSYAVVDLDYLYLPALPSDEEDLAIADAAEQQRVDVLAQLDPREIPELKLDIAALKLGEEDFGRWKFTVDRTPLGIEISKLEFNVRGIHNRPVSDEVKQARALIDFIEQGAENKVNPEQSTSNDPFPHFSWHFDGTQHSSQGRGVVEADDLSDVLAAFGFAPSIESDSATFQIDLNWPGSPAFVALDALNGTLALDIVEGRFLQESGANNALKIISVLNLNALMRRLKFSDDLLRKGLAYDEITGQLILHDGEVKIQDRLVITGPSSLYQLTGSVDLVNETIDGELYLTLPVSNNIPWIGLLTANIPLAVGAYLFERIFGDSIDSLTSAVYTLQGPLDGLEPKFKQAFGSPPDSD